MKLQGIVIAVCFVNCCFAQSSTAKYYQVDETYSPQLLVQIITAADSTDLQKVTSIFNWITQNIDYNVKRFENNSNYRYALEEEEEDTAAQLKPLYERVALLVLKRRTAVCSGYANLFKSLCTHAGIRCEVITGLGKTNNARLNKRFTSNHRWNAVFFDTAWHLLDATWASGFINYRNEFQRQYNPQYFLTAPDEFIKDHYPEDLRWTFLPAPPLLQEFMYTPFKTTAFNKFYIRSYLPAAGIIEAAVSDSIVFEIEADRPGHLWVSDLPYADSNSVFLMQCCGAVQPVNTVTGKKISCTYYITNADTEWLHLICDDEIIMRYKLHIKQPVTPPPPITTTDSLTDIIAD